MPTSLDQLLIVTPHSSGQVPADVLRDMLGDAALDTPTRDAFLRRLFLDGDPYTDVIYALPGARHVNAAWSRFVVDLNRDRDDRVDNGVIKLVDFTRTPLYPDGFTLTAEAREARLSLIWDSFDAQVAARLPGAALMIVGHCMATHGPALGHDTGTPRPAICLMPGEDDAPSFPRAHWPALQAVCEAAFADVIDASPYARVTIGEPWQSDTMSVNHSRRSGVPAFGIEFNAGLYMGDGGVPMDDAIRTLNASFARFAGDALNLLP